MKEYNIMLERELVASLINFSDSRKSSDMIEVMTRVNDYDFTVPDFSNVVTEIKKLWRQGETIDQVTVLNSLRQTHGERAITIYKSVNKEIKGILQPKNPLETFLLLRQETAKRQLRRLAEVRMMRVDADTDPFDEMSMQDDEAMRIKELLYSARRSEKFKDMLIAARADFYKRQAKIKAGDNVLEFPVGISEFDKKIMMERGDLVVLAARPGMGKTAFALYILRSLSKQGKRVLFFSLEMTTKKLIGRIVCGEAGIDSERYRKGMLYEEELKLMNSATDSIYDWSVEVYDAAPMTVEDIYGAVMVEAQKGVDFIIIDYLGLIKLPNRDSRNNELGDITSGLKRLAKKANVPVVALHQLNRKCEERGDKRPLLSDLRDSGNIEQDADIVMFLYRDDYYKGKNQDKDNIVEVLVAKYREGEAPAKIKLSYSYNLTNFNDEGHHKDLVDF